MRRREKKEEEEKEEAKGERRILVRDTPTIVEAVVDLREDRLSRSQQIQKSSHRKWPKLFIINHY